MSHENEDDALANLGRSPEGLILIDNLERTLRYVTAPGIESGALHEFEGSRRLARNLIEKLTRDRDGYSTTAESSARPGTESNGVRSRGARRPVPDAGSA